MRRIGWYAGLLLLCLAPLASTADTSDRLRALELEAANDPRGVIERARASENDARRRTDKAELTWALAARLMAHMQLQDEPALRAALSEEGATLAREHKDVELLVLFTVGGGFVKQQLAAHAQALALFDEAIAISERAGHDRALGRALNAKAVTSNRQGRTAEALGLYFRAHRLFEGAQEKGYWGPVTLMNIAGTYSRLGVSGSARAKIYLEQALRDVASEPGHALVRGAHHHLGVASLALDEPQQAQHHWERCIDLSTRSADAMLAAICRMRLGRLMLSRHRLDESSALLEAALPVFERVGEPNWLFPTQLARAEWYALSGDAPRSRAALHEAQSLARQLKTASHDVQLQEKAAEIHARLGEHELAARYARSLLQADKLRAQTANERLAREQLVWHEVQQIERENETLRARHRTLQADRQALALILALAGMLAAGAAWAVVTRQRRRRHRAEAANVAKARLLAAASGELRQPVRVVNENLLRLADLGLPAQGAALLADARRCAATIDEMFHALLDLSKLDAAEQPVHVQAFALQPLLERVQLQFGPQARAKGLMLKVHASRAWVSSDAQLVERIVHNFVANALRYTERGRVVVGCRAAGRRVRLTVYDSGAGIPADQHEAIFEEFYQVPRLQGERAKGLGLGLAIVKRLARLLGAPVLLRSRPGTGSMFAIELPRMPGGE